MEPGESGVRVNCVLPDFIPTPMISLARGISINEAESKLDKISEEFMETQPIKRSGSPIDIAKAVLWLASDESSFVNGQTLIIEGGVSVGRMWSDYIKAIQVLERALGL
jgi:NAD(P)-dependent dehydrogenase (short-subunit alcohol dehydrogenase family)